MTVKTGFALFFIVLFGSATGRIVADIWGGAYCEMINE